ncbi:MAG: M1 family metallopeptidase [Bacteroidia bacterium]|nr:M1 family metallopeptidase [Bacteroidia bacterium]
MNRSIFVCLFWILIKPVIAQHTHNSYLKDPVITRQHSLDIIKMKVEVSFEPEKGLVKGKVTHEFTVLQQKVDSVFFDAPGINIKSALLNKSAVKFNIEKTGVWVIPQKPLKWDDKGEIVFEYEASPRKGIYFIGWNIPEPKDKNPFAVRKQIWTQGQGVDNRYWIPMYDEMNDKFITETVTTFDKNYEVLSNGKLMSKKQNKNGTTTWHYAMSHPHAGYLLMLGIGKYATASAKSKSGVALNYWYYPEYADRMEPTYRFTPQMIDFLEAQTGIAYPWESYSQIMVQDFLYGAMENTTATIFGDFFNVDERAYLDRNYVGVNCHEMTHQWFGDFITARDSRDAWLQESFATYFPKQFARVTDGEEEWDWQRRQQQNAAVDAGKKDNYGVRHTSGGTARIYPKGAAVISMLEYVLGSEQWKRVLNFYLKKHAYGNVETNDLQQAIKDKSGINLDWFFDEWIIRGGEPHYKISYQETINTKSEKASDITVEQIHKTDETVHYFKMPVVFEVHYTDGTTDSVYKVIEDAYNVVRIENANNKKIAFVLFDPNSNIIKQVSFKKSYEELREQLEKAPHYIDRYDAVVAMREFDKNQKQDALIASLKREKHSGIINELITQLAVYEETTTIAVLQTLAAHSKAGVRDHLYKNAIPVNSWKPLFENALLDSSYEVTKTVLEKLCNQYPLQALTYLNATAEIYGMNNSVKIKWLELYIQNIKRMNADEKQVVVSDQNKKMTDEAHQKLVAYAGAGYEFRTRLLAFGALKSLNLLNNELAGSLYQAILSTNSRLAGPASDLVNFYALQTDFKNQLIKSYQQNNYPAAEKEILTKQLSWLKNL